MSCEQVVSAWFATIILLLISIVINVLLAHDNGLYQGRLEQYETEVEVTEAK